MASVTRHFLLCLCGGAIATALDHGPLIQWSSDPSGTAHLRWLESAENRGVEGRWAAGPGGFGYGDRDDGTVFTKMRGRYDSITIRRAVEVPASVSRDATLHLVADYDDGFVAWINGREVARRNVKEARDGFKAAGNHEAGKPEEILLGTVGEMFSQGKATLAVVGWNVSRQSSDFSLSISLVAKKAGKEVEIVPVGAVWEYLAGAEPEDGWQLKVAGIQREGEARILAKKVEFRAKGDKEWRQAAISRSQFAASEHQVHGTTLHGLPAGSEIEFRLEGSTESFRFRTAPRDGSRLRFVTGGDLFHDRDRMDSMNRRAGAEDPLFALLGGDLAYTNNANPERWFAFVDSWVENARTPDGRLVPMMVAIGNHEVKNGGYRPRDAPGPEAATEFFSLFHMQEKGQARQVIDFGRELSFVLLDSGHSATIASQNAWLEKALRDRRSVRRLFVCYHRPAWGSGTKADANEIRNDWCPLFERFRVDAVFENDHHVYSRTHPIREGKVDEAEGIPYLGAGAWSVGVRGIPDDAFRKRPWLARAEALNHLYVVELRERGWTAEAKTADGRTFDRIERNWRR